MTTLYDVELEKNCLATAIANPNNLPAVMCLTGKDFYDAKCHVLFGIMQLIYQADSIVDITTIKAEIANSQTTILDDVFLADVLMHPVVYNLDGIIKRLREYTQRRKLHNLSIKIKESLNKNSDDLTHEIYTYLNDLNSGLVEEQKIGDSASGDLLNFCLLESDYIKTCFTDLNKIISGFVNSEFLILAGRPGSGKSTLALQLALSASNTTNVLYFSLEMINKSLVRKALANLSGVEHSKIKNGEYGENDNERLVRAQADLQKKNLYIIDNSYTIESILNTIRRLNNQMNIGLVVIDYLQQIEVGGNEQRYVKVGSISRSIKRVCNELSLPTLALAQLGRSANEMVPKISDLRESGNLEQDADIILLLHPDQESGMTNLIVGKDRDGRVGVVNLFFDKKISRFNSATKFYE